MKKIKPYTCQKKKKLALKLGIQTYQILANDDEVCIRSLSSILLFWWKHGRRHRHICLKYFRKWVFNLIFIHLLRLTRYLWYVLPHIHDRYYEYWFHNSLKCWFRKYFNPYCAGPQIWVTRLNWISSARLKWYFRRLHAVPFIHNLPDFSKVSIGVFILQLLG